MVHDDGYVNGVWSMYVLYTTHTHSHTLIFIYYPTLLYIFIVFLLFVFIPYTGKLIFSSHIQLLVLIIYHPKTLAHPFTYRTCNLFEEGVGKIKSKLLVLPGT